MGFLLACPLNTTTRYLYSESCDSYLLLQASWHDSFQLSLVLFLHENFLRFAYACTLCCCCCSSVNVVMGHTSNSMRFLLICPSVESSGHSISAMGPNHLNNSCSHKLVAVHLACLACFLCNCSQCLQVAGLIDQCCDFLDIPTCYWVAPES